MVTIVVNAVSGKMVWGKAKQEGKETSHKQRKLLFVISMEKKANKKEREIPSSYNNNISLIIHIYIKQIFLSHSFTNFYSVISICLHCFHSILIHRNENELRSWVYIVVKAESTHTLLLPAVINLRIHPLKAWFPLSPRYGSLLNPYPNQASVCLLFVREDVSGMYLYGDLWNVGSIYHDMTTCESTYINYLIKQES